MRKATRSKDIGEHLTKAVRAVVRQNPSLSGVIDVVVSAAERSGEPTHQPAKLREVVETFSDARYRLGLADVRRTFLAGHTSSYGSLRKARGSAREFAADGVGFLMAHIIRPKPANATTCLRLRWVCS